MNVPSRSQISAGLLSICRNFATGRTTTISSCNVPHKHGFHQDTDRSCCPNFNTPLTRVLLTTHSSRGFLSSLLGTNRYHSIHYPSSRFHTFQDVSRHPNMCIRKLAGQHVFTVRHKSKKKQHDSEEESDSEIDDNLDEDDFEAPTQFKVQTIHAPSLRIDAILSKALGLSRNRLEEIFFGPGFLLNGKKLLKKAGKMDKGDYVDVVMEKAEDQLRVKRVKLLKVGSQRTSTDKFAVKVRVWKVPFCIDDPDRWRHDS